MSCFFVPVAGPIPVNRLPAGSWRLVGTCALCALLASLVVLVCHDSWGDGAMSMASFHRPTANRWIPAARQHGATLKTSPETATARDCDWLTVYWDGRYACSRLINRARRKVRRTRAEIERERRELLEKTNREIDAIVAEYHAKLPRGEAKAIGAIYARYSSRFQDSIADQVRTLFETAYQLGIFIPKEYVFFDMAVRGWKDRRPGLTALRQAIKSKAFHVFLVFTTSRLFRRTYKALQFVEEELVERGIRGVFVKSHIDTADGDNWRTTFQMLAAMDEAMVRMYAEHVRAAHEGLFLRGMVYGSLPLGYTGEAVQGEFTKRKLPRRRIVVDSETAPTVVRIFQWYVVERLTLDEIARRLNDDPEAPAPNKSLTGWWTHSLVRKHLMLAAYRGSWAYGAAKTKWSSDKDYAQKEMRAEPLKTGQFENLRIVSDEIWYAAQKRLAVEVAKSGRKRKDGTRNAPCLLLRQLFVCPQHNRQLVVGGAHGSVLFCPICRAVKTEERPLFTHLNRALALRLTCEKLTELVRADEPLVEAIIAACQQEAELAQQPDPEAERQLRGKLDRISKTIDFNRRNPGESDEEQAQTKKLLKQLRSDRAAMMAELSAVEAAKNRHLIVPTAERVRQMLDELHSILLQAATSRDDAQLGKARRIIELLTSGRIELYQMGERLPRQGWLQGRFKIGLLSFLVERLTGVRPLGNDQGMEVTIDYREPPEFIALSEKAKALYDTEMMNALIAKELGVARNYVTKLLRYWFESRGLVMPDGRGRRASLKRKHIEPPLNQQIADDVMVLYRQDMLLQDIATRFKADRNTITAAIRWWHEIRGLPVPDGRTRRKALDMKTSRPNDVAKPPPKPDPSAEQSGGGGGQ